MPAIDALPVTTVEGRPTANPAPGENSSATDSQACDAFIAALLAQTVTPPAPAEVPQASTPIAVAVAGGQLLPTVRPTLAGVALSQRASSSAQSDAIEGSPGLPVALPVGSGAEDDFAAAFATLQDSSGAAPAGGLSTTGGDADPKPLADGAGLTPNAGHGMRTEQLLDALAGLQGARGSQGNVGGHTYDVKPPALPIDQPALFAARLNQHISVMLGDQLQSAQIAVSPAELGPVEVRVTLVGDEAKIQLVASHATTREALADALPRLRASFADAGLSLAQAGVFAQMPERQHPQTAFDDHSGHGDGDFEPRPLAALPAGRALRIGLIDAFV